MGKWSDNIGLLDCCKCISFFGILFYVLNRIYLGGNGLHNNGTGRVSKVQTWGPEGYSRGLFCCGCDRANHICRNHHLPKLSNNKEGRKGKLLRLKKRKRVQKRNGFQGNCNGRSQNDQGKEWAWMKSIRAYDFRYFYLCIDPIINAFLNMIISL